jgi:hypothetical protein
VIWFNPGVVLLRWFLPVLAVLALLASSLTAFAGTGVVGSSECCCPDPDTCKCHDHDEGPEPASELTRCGGEARLVAPHVAAAIEVTPALPAVVTLLVHDIVHTTLPMPAPRYDRPEKPPS